MGGLALTLDDIFKILLLLALFSAELGCRGSCLNNLNFFLWCFSCSNLLYRGSDIFGFLDLDLGKFDVNVLLLSLGWNGLNLHSFIELD